MNLEKMIDESDNGFEALFLAIVFSMVDFIFAVLDVVLDYES